MADDTGAPPGLRRRPVRRAAGERSADEREQRDDGGEYDSQMAEGAEEGPQGPSILPIVLLVLTLAAWQLISAWESGGSGSHAGGERSRRAVSHATGGIGPHDAQLHAHVDLAQLHAQAIVNVSLHRAARCSACAGHGGSGRHTCPRCQGRGQLVTHARTPFGIMQHASPCHHCGGQGHVLAHTCEACGGRGVKHEHVTVPVRLTAGLRGGDIVKLPLQGDALSSRGDDTASVIVQLHERATRSSGGGAALRRCAPEELPTPDRRSADLCGEVTVSLREALMGFERTVASPAGEGRAVRVARHGPTQPGEMLRFSGAGMPRRPASWSLSGRTFPASDEPDGPLLEVQELSCSDSDAHGGASGGEGDSAAGRLVRSVSGWLRPFARHLPRLLRDQLPASWRPLGPGSDSSKACAPGGLAPVAPEEPPGFGDALIRVSVRFPHSLTRAQREALAAAFPTGPGETT